MSEKQPESSWDKLLGDLGAEPDKAAYERHQPESTDIPPELDWEAADAAAEAAQPTAGDWNTLADSLGLEGEAPAAAEEKAPEPVAEKKAVEAQAEKPKQDKKAKQDSAPAPFGGFLAPETPVVEEVEEEAAAEFEAVEDDLEEEIVAEVEAADGFDDDFADDFDDDDDDEVGSLDDELPPLPNATDQALIDTTWEDDESETNSKQEAETSDGTGISGEAARSAFDALFSDGSSSWGSAFLDKPNQVEDSADEEPKSELAESVDAKTGADSEGEGEEGDRPKRKRSRRRRRGGRGRKSSRERAEGEATSEVADGEQTSDGSDEESSSDLSENVDGEEKKKPRRRRSRRRRSSKSGDEKTKATSDATNDDDDLLAAASGDEESDASDSPRSEGRGRQRHRNLPTWADAIGVIVDTNLESRAKSPSKPQSSRSGRGGRGRGGRGGRGRGGRSGGGSGGGNNSNNSSKSENS